MSPKRPFLALTLASLLFGSRAHAQDVVDPVDPIEDKALKQEAAAKFEEALRDFREAFSTAVEEAQKGGEVRDRNLARAEVLLQKIESLTEVTTSQASSEDFLAGFDESKVGPLLKGHLDWNRAKLLLAEGDRDGAAKIGEGLGFVRDWWIIGPFDNERGTGFKKPLKEVEGRIDLDGKELLGKDQRKCTWRKLPVRPHFGLVDLDTLMRPNDQAYAYGVAFVKSEAAQDAAIRLGSDEAVKVWWNGKQVLARDVRRSLGWDQDVVPVRLSAGWNVLLVKCCDQTGEWGYRLRITTPEGGRPAGVTVAQTREEADAAIAAAPTAEEPQAQAATGAKSWYDQATNVEAKRARDLFHLGLLHHGREFDSYSERKAENLLKAAAEAEPTNAIYRFHYAEAASPPTEMVVEKEENKQRQGREKALEADPGYAVAYRALAGYYTHSLVNYEKAEDLLRKALEVNPAYVEARLDLAAVLKRRGLNAQSEVERTRALADARSTKLESLARARAADLENRGMSLEALAAWNEVLRLDQRGNDVRRRVAEIAASALKRDDAIAVLDAIVAQNPYDIASLRRKAEILEGTEDYAGAKKVLQEVLAIAPEDDEVLQQLGRVQAKAGERDAAIATFHRALELNQKLQNVERYVEYLDPAAAPYEDDYAVDAKPLLDKVANWDNKENDPWVTVLDQTVTKVNKDGTSAAYTRQIHKILNDAGVKRFDRYWARGWGQLKWKWARVHRADGTVIDAKISGSQADFPALRAGDVIDVAHRHDDREQSYFGDYYGDSMFFADYVPVVRSEWTLITPAERTFYFHQRNFAVKPVVTETEADGHKFRIYTWTAQDVPKVREEVFMPDAREQFPQVQVTTYKDWDEFSRWWAGMIRDQQILSDEMKAKVAELVKDKESRFEKIRAIYEFVAGEVTYQAWSFGEHGYKPYTTTAIFDKREGDCKDKALLLCTMFENIGVESFPVLIYAEEGRSEEDMTLPMVGQFNHCICYVPDADGMGTPMYLDGTAQYHSMHRPPSMDRGAKVLIVKPEGGVVETIPVGVPDDTGIDQTWKLTVRPDGSGVVEGELRWKGDLATQCRQLFSVEGQRPQMLQQFLTPLFGKLKIVSHDFDDLKDLSKPVASFRVTLEVSNLAKADGDGFGLASSFFEQFVLRQMLPRWSSLAKREHDLVLSNPMSFKVSATYVLPEGWTVAQKPDDSEIAAAAGRFSSKTVQVGREVRLDRVFETVETRVRKADYPAFREALTRIQALVGQRFKVKSGGAPAETPKAPEAPAPETPKAPEPPK